MRPSSSTALLLLLGLSAPALAEETLSARPTAFVGSDNLEFGEVGASLHLGISARSPEFGPGLQAEGELSLLLRLASNLQLSLLDNSSFLRLRWRPETWQPGEGLSLTVLPLHSDRLFLGSEFPIARTLQAPGQLSPGGDLRLVRESWHVFVSLKSGMGMDDADQRQLRRYTVFAGGALEVLSTVRLEAAAGHADQGAARSINAVSGRLLCHFGPEIGPAVDFARHGQDPGIWEKLLRGESYPGGLSGAAVGEVLYLSQTGLADPANIEASVSQPALGFAVEGRLRWDDLRVYLRGQYRSVTFLLPETPYPSAALPVGGRQAEVGGSAALDYHVERLGLTPGIAAAVLLPASFAGPQFGKTYRYVLRDAGRVQVLPGTQARGAVGTLKATLRWDSTSFAAIGEASYTYDPNRVGWSDLGTMARFSSDVFGFNVFIQARF